MTITTFRSLLPTMHFTMGFSANAFFVSLIFVMIDPDVRRRVRRLVGPALTRVWRFVARLMCTFYRNHRSERSRLIGYILGYPTDFECGCCALRLGAQDVDKLYHQNCVCHSNSGSTKVIFCKHCVCTDIKTQVMDSQVTKPRCLSARQCVLDDRLVRKRLQRNAIAVLDRNQIIEASQPTASLDSAQGQDRTEKLWHCPSPNCTYTGFLSSTTSPNPERLSYWQSLRRYFGTFKTMEQHDARRIFCPRCRIASCQFCAQAWTRLDVNHTGKTCAEYDRAAVDPLLLEAWKVRSGAQNCRQCHAMIEKNDGCKHMTCRCGYQFCWTCGVPWTDRHAATPCQPVGPASAAADAVPANLIANNNALNNQERAFFAAMFWLTDVLVVASLNLVQLFVELLVCVAIAIWVKPWGMGR